MKKAVSIVLGLCLVCQCLVQLGIMGWYQLNKAYIAANLCENRARPEMHCNGKCYLKKQLKKAGETQQKNGENTKTETAQVVVFIIPGYWQQAAPDSDRPQLQHHSRYRATAGISTLEDIFHPPQAA